MSKDRGRIFSLGEGNLIVSVDRLAALASIVSLFMILGAIALGIKLNSDQTNSLAEAAIEQTEAAIERTNQNRQILWAISSQIRFIECIMLLTQEDRTDESIQSCAIQAGVRDIQFPRNDVHPTPESTDELAPVSAPPPQVIPVVWIGPLPKEAEE